MAIIFPLIFALAYASAAAAQSPDARIIVIDLPWFAQIDDDRQRQRALDDVVADVAMFARTGPAQAGTLFIAPRRVNMPMIAKSPPGQSGVAELRESREFGETRNGVAAWRYVRMSVQQIREAVYSGLRHLGIDRSRQGRLVDLHVFAPGWRLDRTDYMSDLMGTEQATVCVINRGTVGDVWPQHIGLQVEFRVPEGVRRPSASAEAAFIGVLTGHSIEMPHVRTRGSAGPRCDLAAADMAVGFIDPSMVDNPDCAADALVVGQVNPAMNACRSNAPQAPAIGAGLERSPVFTVVRPVPTGIAQARLEGSLLSIADSAALIGGVEVLPGVARRAAMPQAPTPSLFRVKPSAACQPGADGALTLGVTPQAVTAVISRFACEEIDLPIGLVGLK